MTKLKAFEVIVKSSAEWTGTIKAMSCDDAKHMAKREFNQGQLRQCDEEVVAVLAWRQRTRTGSWATFERRFRPIDSPDHTVWWSREQLPVDIDPHLVWTIVDCEGKLCVSPGFHIVNRIDYVVCEAPWTEEDIYQPPYHYD
jgi:hypothetical protein